MWSTALDEPSKHVETLGSIDEEGRLRLHGELPITGPREVRVTVSYESPSADWIRVATTDPAFSLKDI